MESSFLLPEGPVQHRPYSPVERQLLRGTNPHRYQIVGREPEPSDAPDNVIRDVMFGAAHSPSDTSIQEGGSHEPRR